MEAQIKPTLPKPIQKAVAIFEELSFENKVMSFSIIKEIYSHEVARERETLLAKSDELESILENLKA